MDDRAKFYHSVRASTIALLGYDPNNLTLQQSLKVDLASSLCLEIDRITAAQLSGTAVDLRELILATESLTRLMSPAAGDASISEFAGAREELAALILHRIENIRARDEMQADAAERADAELEKPDDVEAALGVASSTPARSVVRPPDPEPPPQPPWGVPPTEPAAAPETDIQKMNRVNAQKPPAHYLRGPDEPWRPFVNEDGIISR
jgi:hypothetical protein